MSIKCTHILCFLCDLLLSVAHREHFADRRRRKGAQCDRMRPCDGGVALGFSERDTYFTQSTSFDGEASGEGESVELTRRERIDGKLRLSRDEGTLVKRSGPIQIGPSEAMYLEYGLVRFGDGRLGLAYQAKDAMATWSGWELSEEIGAVGLDEALARLQEVIGETDRYSGAGRGAGTAEPERW